MPYDSYGVMAVSAVLTADGKTVGVLRFISSLRGVDEDVRSVSKIFIIIGAVVAVMSMLLSFLLSNTIVNPLRRVTDAAARMAAGISGRGVPKHIMMRSAGCPIL